MTAFGDLAEIISTEAGSRDSYTVNELASLIDKDHSALVDEWLREARFTLLTQYVGDHLRHIRHELQRRKKAREEGWSVFDQDFTVSEDNMRKSLGDMTGKDHLFVANTYARDAAQARMKEDLHRLIAKKVGKKKTRNVFTEEQMLSLFGNYAPDPSEEKAA